MTAFIDAHREDFGVEPICTTLQFAPSTCYAAKARTPSPQTQRDEALTRHVKRIWDEHYQVYGARKIRRQLHREGRDVGRCAVERLMRELGIAGVVRGEPKRTTIPAEAAERPADLVERDFTATRPDEL